MRRDGAAKLSALALWSTWHNVVVHPLIPLYVLIVPHIQTLSSMQLVAVAVAVTGEDSYVGSYKYNTPSGAQLHTSVQTVCYTNSGAREVTYTQSVDSRMLGGWLCTLPTSVTLNNATARINCQQYPRQVHQNRRMRSLLVTWTRHHAESLVANPSVLRILLLRKTWGLTTSDSSLTTRD